MSSWRHNVVDPENWYFHFGPVADFVADAAFDREAFVAARGGADAPDHDLVTHQLVGDRTFLDWVRNEAHEYYTPDGAVIEGATLAVPALAPGSWKGHWRHTTLRGESGLLGQLDLEVTGEGELPPLPVPPFARDDALRLVRTGP